eukprot:9198203-Ditylum_brightwellii.AAC.1
MVGSDGSMKKYCWYFLHANTCKKVSWNKPDPRLASIRESDDVQKLKDKLLSELRFNAYVCRGALQGYYDAEQSIHSSSSSSKKQQQQQQQQPDHPDRDQIKKLIKEMGLSLSKARDVWDNDFFENNEEFQYFTSLQEELLKVKIKIEERCKEMEENRSRVLTSTYYYSREK